MRRKSFYLFFTRESYSISKRIARLFLLSYFPRDDGQIPSWIVISSYEESGIKIFILPASQLLNRDRKKWYLYCRVKVIRGEKFVSLDIFYIYIYCFDKKERKSNIHKEVAKELINKLIILRSIQKVEKTIPWKSLFHSSRYRFFAEMRRVKAITIIDF